MLCEVDRENNERDGDVEDESEREIVVQHGSKPVELVEQPVEEESIRNEKSERRHDEQPHKSSVSWCRARSSDRAFTALRQCQAPGYREQVMQRIAVETSEPR